MNRYILLAKMAAICVTFSSFALGNTHSLYIDEMSDTVLVYGIDDGINVWVTTTTPDYWNIDIDASWLKTEYNVGAISEYWSEPNGSLVNWLIFSPTLLRVTSDVNAPLQTHIENGSNYYLFNDSLTISFYDHPDAEQGSAVPDGGMTVALLGGALLSFAALRRRIAA